MMNKITISIILLASISIYAQKPTLFIGGVAHIGNGNVIQNSVISIYNGKFQLVADATSVKINPNAFDTIIEVFNKHLYPSFILPNTTLGITEIDAVRASRDFKETGTNNPNVRSLIAYNTDSKLAKTVRSNGVLIAQVTPRGGVISGQSSIIHLDGENWEDAVLRTDDGIHINWPTRYYKHEWWKKTGTSKKNKEYQNKILDLNKIFAKANSYKSSSKIMDLKMESIKGLFDGTKRI